MILWRIREDEGDDSLKKEIMGKEIKGYSMVNAIENVVSFPVTFSQGRM